MTLKKMAILITVLGAAFAATLAWAHYMLDDKITHSEYTTQCERILTSTTLASASDCKRAMGDAEMAALLQGTYRYRLHSLSEPLVVFCVRRRLNASDTSTRHTLEEVVQTATDCTNAELPFYRPPKRTES